MTPARKRWQMLLLVRDMAAAQSSFNTRIIGLRDEKRELLRRLNASRARLAVINKVLGITGAWRHGMQLHQENLVCWQNCRRLQRIREACCRCSSRLTLICMAVLWCCMHMPFMHE